ncbi:MAG: trypsin-like peptidase domain-containing protein [Clostridia bacterium]|nr:trypsin-like peptidase domain-containing protein [Clostridia bacterium]
MSEEIRNNGHENTNEPTQPTPPPSIDPTPKSEERNSYESRETPQCNYENRGYSYTPYNTGYYSSANRDGNQSGGMYSYPLNNQPFNNPYQPPLEPKKKKEKKKGNFGLIIGCILLSLVCGFAGAFGGMYLFNETNKEEPSQNTGTNNPPNDSTVLFETVDRELPESTTKAGTVATVAAVTLPSVVEIRTEAVVNNSFYGQYVTEGAGSGVVISKDGYIVTNNHVISGASNITVRFTNGDEYKARLIGTDAQTDIAVIKVEATDLVPAVFGDSSKLVIGELTVAIGNPLGELGGTVTDGIISALDREITVEGETMVLLQTNAAVSPGNSGGGLFNSNGELIGIVNAKSSGSSVEGLGFAIPANTAKTIIKDLMEKGHVTGRPSIGISIIEVTTDYQRYMYGVSSYGVYIQKALNEEFQSGDRIIAIDGNSVSTSSDIKSIINGHKVGDTVTVTVARKNKMIDVQVTLIDSADNTLANE